MLAVAVLAVIFIAITADHSVKSYYLENDTRAPAICIKAEENWVVDDVIYCTDEYTKAIDFVVKANASLKGKQ
jgi:hypothetical protein